ncbi:MAG: prepilin-type N-terminal cleavage/methylation domain-containing protein [Myxococcota bacterium]|nr:prepilin-type N-terminal cleavage/methylation domain-containing protein [Myxococcales bacterium]
MDELTTSRRLAATPARAADRRRGGVTLIELMVALTVLAFGLLTVAAAQIHALRGSTTGRHQTMAASIAQSQMEQLQRVSWNDPSLNPGGWTAPIVVNQVVEAPVNMIEQTYALSWRVTDLVVGQRRSIDVRVTWNDPNRPNRSYAVSSVRYNYENL